MVAFSAICAHKLVYPTTAISFIGLRSGQRGEPANVIHCCGDNSQYDPLHGARVIDGPAPQPLAAVLWSGTRAATSCTPWAREAARCSMRSSRSTRRAGARERQRAAQNGGCDGGRAAGGELQPAVAQLGRTGNRAASRRPPADRDRAAPVAQNREMTDPVDAFVRSLDRDEPPPLAMAMLRAVWHGLRATGTRARARTGAGRRARRLGPCLAAPRRGCRQRRLWITRGPSPRRDERAKRDSRSPGR